MNSNSSTILDVAPPTARPLKWRYLHRKAYFYLTSFPVLLIGGFAGMFVARGLEYEHRISEWLALGLILFGVLLGCLVSCAWFLVKHLCFPEETAK